MPSHVLSKCRFWCAVIRDDDGVSDTCILLNGDDDWAAMRKNGSEFDDVIDDKDNHG